MAKHWLTAEEAAEYAGVHPQTIRWAIRHKRIKARHISPRKVRVTKLAVNHWLRNEGWHRVGRPHKDVLDRRENMRDNLRRESVIRARHPDDLPIRKEKKNG